MANKTRSILTGLGIIFGVAAVITMLAVGNGAQQKILEQMELVGVNNIVVMPDLEKETTSLIENDPKAKKKFSPGLTLKDMEAITGVLPSVRKICPEVSYETFVIANGLRRPTKLIGVNADYFDVFNLKLQKGNVFSPQQIAQGKPVCVIGANLAARLFPGMEAIGQIIKCDNVTFRVIGILGSVNEIGSSLTDMGINNYNDEVYAPIHTILLRYDNRALVTQRDINEAGSVWFDEEGGEGMSVAENYNQLDKIVIQLDESNVLGAAVDVLYRLLKRTHLQVEDFKIVVPEQLLQQQKETDDVFRWLLGAIASISLLVGGIGIMNIMLASVMERIKEIGLRMAIGAKKSEIRLQFISEAFLISVSGGLLGILIGVMLSFIISYFLDMPTTISALSVIASFGVSAGVGILFGYMPAKKAADQDPVHSLRYE